MKTFSRATKLDPLSADFFNNAEFSELLRSRNWIVAFSGGADSVLLFHLLSRISSEHSLNKKISLLYFDHSLPYETSIQAEREKIFAQVKASSTTPIEWIEKKIPVRRVSRALNFSFERAASLLRRRHAFRIAKSRNSILFWGHNLSDWYETLILRLNRGASPDKLAPFDFLEWECGIPSVRPLHNLLREEVRETAASENLQWWDDPENTSGSNRRAVVRKSLPVFNADGIRRSAELFLETAKSRKNLKEKLRSLFEPTQARNEIHIPLSNYKSLSTEERILLKQTALNDLGLSVFSQSLLIQLKSDKSFHYGPYWVEKEGELLVVRKGRGNFFQSSKRPEGALLWPEITKSHFIQLSYGRKSVKKIISERKLSERQKRGIFFLPSKNSTLEIEKIILSNLSEKNITSNAAEANGASD